MLNDCHICTEAALRPNAIDRTVIPIAFESYIVQVAYVLSCCQLALLLLLRIP